MSGSATETKTADKTVQGSTESGKSEASKETAKIEKPAGAGATTAATDVKVLAGEEAAKTGAGDGTAAVEGAQKTEPGEKKAADYSGLTLPDGSLLEPKALDQVKSFAQKNALTADQAQKLLEMRHEDAAAARAAHVETMKAKNHEWIGVLQGDKDFGGAKFKEASEMAKRGLEFADPTGVLTKVVEESGLTNLPQLVHAFARIGYAMKDDKLVKEPAQPGARKKDHEVFFDSPKK